MALPRRSWKYSNFSVGKALLSSTSLFLDISGCNFSERGASIGKHATEMTLSTRSTTLAQKLIFTKGLLLVSNRGTMKSLLPGLKIVLELRRWFWKRRWRCLWVHDREPSSVFTFFSSSSFWSRSFEGIPKNEYTLIVWSSARKSLVKGERFSRTNAEDPEITIPHIVSRSRSGCCVCPPG